MTIVSTIRHNRIISVVLLTLLATAVPLAAGAQGTTVPASTTWTSLKGDVFGQKAVEPANGIITIEAPKRAEDAALVPIDLHFKTDATSGRIKTVTLIVDENPSPVAAVFKFGKDAGVTHLATRLRVNAYSYVRAIAETEDGKLHMTETFVKASGGCSAPALKNQDEAVASLGKMKLRVFPSSAPGSEPMTRATEMQLMIRHPNNSGLQMDQITRYYIPAHFIQGLTVSQGDRLIMSMEGGISISEDPNFRFEFDAKPGEDVKVEAADTEGKKFQNEWPLQSSSL
ncbi:quinoprotein dehydrogenase-associated SoxYZ-like carrier [Phyllobacterium brassicacearum]|uniref:Quinoprotein dehydrogenase-associated SoxYZ-like carrier n=1 Tax=Phyllobacterium brassicacearum TaxID=314235 RepID=A0A2P7BQV6_9HYPH|nr:quinoprotein dehydrogenase-associated SoxYZ-like carrier [Phyllobacterium brassicacearum]PSH68848.1 quinoprotein dehydrogenase-associated SoxYZ-like carrier [Phyllobacterium brassicacearum]TDQ33582.1 sulfur-oxidizing protein SoxY [Phyllobacterium brassicacearum]